MTNGFFRPFRAERWRVFESQGVALGWFVAAPSGRPGCGYFRAVPRFFHCDEDGTISLLSVFAVLIMTMILGMVMNVGRQMDGKIRIQNAADAAAYSGGVAIARGMNTLAFTNNLLCEVFSMTALMREAQEQNAQKFVPSILAAWTAVGPMFKGSGFADFNGLSSAIAAKVPMEQQLVNAFSQWGNAASEQILPLMEEILSQEMIPQYQRAVVQAFPDIAQTATGEAAARDGNPDHGRGPMFAVLWRTSAVPVGGDGETGNPTLPVVDPEQEPGPGNIYRTESLQWRNNSALTYLNEWNDNTLAFFDNYAKMSQFGALWRGFTCGQLTKLCDEYATSNLPFVICTQASQVTDPTASTACLAEYFTFLSVAYWHRVPEMCPKLFVDPTGSDAVAFAEVRVFIPTPRLVWEQYQPTNTVPIGGIPGGNLPPIIGPPPTGTATWNIGRQPAPVNWDLTNQNWSAQIVPATQPCLPTILTTTPSLPGFTQGGYVLPSLGSLSSTDIGYISPH
jgi:hypothetical protein